ncbi:DUF1585 domain-containing protein [Myxococcus sp. CA051A]|uniref:DUF1585 domain-containing protein n=1 Tax=unclassified Myxococcus TaxID=2648731 RepID=UPI00157AF96E|nr:MULTISPECIES: DUF1585 domain-containing protein [unclassified Myxococcus]NTX16514.1 DUF1585 domain-containing protein [Myxococcus sp. CA056]NTX55788.1 DUF1585 domain-containing protein [Myxococcus sp. CA039A]NTX62741.1 DUF1585 domain-containing protein [Myxococcus sp. CA051A]
MTLGAAFLTLTLTLSPAQASDDAASTPVVELVQVLSLRLRLKRLEPQERRDLEERLARGETPSRIYEEVLDRWLTRDFYRKLSSALAFTPAATNFFVGTLSRFREDGQWVYYLPHTVGASRPEGTAPCAPAERKSAPAWWGRGQRISICQDSYRPENAFDAVGYCGGQPEPTIPTPPRPGCGCGPLLLGCLPPDEEAPRMDQRFVEAMMSEVTETGAELMSKGRPFDELMTTSSTWQSGLTRFLYLRREMLAKVSQKPFSPAREQELVRMLATVDLEAPGQFVERKGEYQGSGLFLNTPVMAAFVGTSRATMQLMLSQFLCVDFPANTVDSETLLTVTGGQHEGVRFEVYESPMRNQGACSGCHAPMDSGSGFLVGLRPPIFGSIPTGRQVEGALYVHGAEDFRGKGKGTAALARLLTQQPEFPRCATSRMFTFLVGRPPRKTAEERRLLEELTRTFEQNGRRVDVLIRAILWSKPQTEPMVLAQ